MKILIVINAGLSLESFFGCKTQMFETAKKLNIDLEILTNAEIKYYYDNSGIHTCLPKYDAVLFYSKDTNLAFALEQSGYKVFNSSKVISLCDSKVETYKILAENKIKIPKTFVIPLTFFYNEALLENFKNIIVSELNFPLIAKKWFGSKGEQVFLIKNKSELDLLIQKESGKELLFQEFFKECFGTDIRINIVNGKIVSCIKRKSTNGDFRSNLSIGSVAENYLPNDEEKSLALKSAEVLGCDFCGVDILQTNKGAVVCEVNSNAQMRLTSKFSGENIFYYILKYIKEKVC